MPKGLPTVNVIFFSDITNYQIDELYSFQDDTEGNKRAESRFKELVLEHDQPGEQEIEDAIENGCFEFSPQKVLLLAHST